jgi:phage-related protein
MPDIIHFEPSVNPNSEMNVDVELRTKTYQYGDGYAVDAGDGINSDLGTFSPRWTNLRYEEAIYIIDFFRERKGYQRFYWTPNGEEEVRVFICNKFNYKWKRGRFCDIEATFEERAPS